MKILQVNCVFKNGSTGKITYDLHTAFQERGIESVVCYGRGLHVDEPHVYKVCPEWYSKMNNAISRVTGIMYGGLYFSTYKLKKFIQKEKPDIVHLQCINGYFVNIYELIKWLKIKRIKTVLTLHAEFMYTGGCGYSIDCHQWRNLTGCGYSKCPRWRAETRSLFVDRTSTMWNRMKRSFEEFEDIIVVSVSPWLKERAENSAILSGMDHRVVLNGLDTNIFHKYDDTERIVEELGAKKHKIIFHATPSFTDAPGHLKGGRYVLELAHRMPDVAFLIAGPHSIQREIPSNVLLLGKVTNQEKLAHYYSLADLTLLTSERETFSMICAESLACGTPVVGFKAGAPEVISLPEYSKFVNYGDLDALQCAANEVMGVKKDAVIEIEAQKKYDKNKMVDEYLNIYSELLRR